MRSLLLFFSAISGVLAWRISWMHKEQLQFHKKPNWPCCQKLFRPVRRQKHGNILGLWLTAPFALGQDVVEKKLESLFSSATSNQSRIFGGRGKTLSSVVVLKHSLTNICGLPPPRSAWSHVRVHFQAASTWNFLLLFYLFLTLIRL